MDPVNLINPAMHLTKLTILHELTEHFMVIKAIPLQLENLRALTCLTFLQILLLTTIRLITFETFVNQMFLIINRIVPRIMKQ